MARIDDILENAKEQNNEQSLSLDDAFAFGVNGRSEGTGVPRKVFEEPEVESISGVCPECEERGGLNAKQGKESVEVYCDECGVELLEYSGSASPSAILNSSDRDSFCVRFRDS